MSFLNSVLNSISAENGQDSPSVNQTSSQQPPLSIREKGSQRNIKKDVNLQTNKRKAEDALEPPNGKVRNVTRIAAASMKASSCSPTGKAKSPSNGLSTMQVYPYRGTQRPSPTPPSPYVPPPDAVKQPKKGSWQEVMARAQASQAKVPAVGVISHKPREKSALSHKKELKLKKQEIQNKKLGIKTPSRPSSSDRQKGNKATLPTSGKIVPQPSYQGTMKPKPQPSYKGTMQAGPAKSKKAASGPSDPPKRRSNEYAATDDELDDEEDEEDDDEQGYGYSEDESDDMEAGFSDVEEEETAAARTARKEDEEEARLEAKLKSDKEDRKRRLAQMAKQAKPPRY